MVKLLYSDACLSIDQKYRYSLIRVWKPSWKLVNFIMLNPSTADAIKNDRTISRCIAYANDWGYDGIVVTNLFALRATNPDILTQDRDPVGSENDEFLKHIADGSSMIVAAWGKHGKFLDRDKKVMSLLFKYPIFCLGTNKNGTPKHPLYLAKDIKQEIFKGKLK